MDWKEAAALLECRRHSSSRSHWIWVNCRGAGLPFSGNCKNSDLKDVSMLATDKSLSLSGIPSIHFHRELLLKADYVVPARRVAMGLGTAWPRRCFVAAYDVPEEDPDGLADLKRLIG